MTLAFARRDAWWRGARFPPRQWQREALPRTVAALRRGAQPLVHAVMGAGKSLFLTELAYQAMTECNDKQIVVISTPTIALVEQLVGDLEHRCGTANVGAFYTDAKTIRPVTVACNPSLNALALEATERGRRCVLWIVDEAHNSESDQLLEAAAALNAVAVVGLTATPFRSGESESLSLFTELAYSYGPGPAMRDGVVVPWDVRPWMGSQRSSLDAACVQMIREVLEEGAGPGVVDAGGIDQATGKPMKGTKDAERFAARLNSEGIRAAAVHSFMKRRDVKHRLAQLEHGKLDVVVHVAMLKEGVNLPWLRWLCLRRKVSSRVWFCQHVGRVLRSHPGKDKAIILDPHDLFGLHSLTYEAVLGANDDEDPLSKEARKLLKQLAEERDELAGGQLGFGYTFCHDDPKTLTKLERYLRKVVGALETGGVIVRKKVIPAGRWRSKPITENQLDTMERAGQCLARAQGVPAEVLESLRWVYANQAKLKRGAASDFLDIAFNLARRPWPAEADLLLATGKTERLAA